MPNVAAMVRESKDARPSDYCPHPRCLWLVVTRHGRRPCPTHMQSERFEVTPAGRDALEEAILVEQQQHDFRVLDEAEESSGDLYDSEEGA